MKKLKRFMLAIILAFSTHIVAGEVGAEVTNYPNGVASWGVPILPGIGSNAFTGNIYFVDSGDTNAADGAGGGTFTEPFSTIDFAVGRCTANNSDVVIVKAGHVETITAASGLDIDVAGITFLGLGDGTSTPRIRFTTATTADLDIDAVAANTTMINFLFESRMISLAAPIDIGAPDCKLINIETRDIYGQGSTTNWIVTDANSDRLLIDGWRHIGTTTAGDGTGGPVSALSLTGGDDIIVRNFNLLGAWAISGIMATTTDCTRLNINGGRDWSYVWTNASTDSAISCRASTGFVGPNIAVMVADNASNITEAVAGGSMQFINPIEIANLAGERSTSTNITYSTD